jgi:hypothetical protein
MGYWELTTDFEDATDDDLKEYISALEPHWRDLNKEWYISSESIGIDNIACGLEDYPCKTIIYTLRLDPSYYSDYDPPTDPATLILL